ncbi:hypothetical protein L249_0414 [Ophiocordyceps polyrhachis-furcata BCC 54312]|uniref:Uncharacterized protein n=1 Tax=Ophiocordyceps polyrhachis-furcata BCC 54312 TaxID=1330021 RepID=A0A367LDI7_9HYPO|nr:hypothetical protein L249_0414 [Ophiocordyceps polyrhachis-furcata BCC 54312]
MDSQAFRDGWNRLNAEFDEMVEPLRKQKDELITQLSQLSGKISEMDRLASAAERQRSAILFRRPLTREGRFQLHCLQEDMTVINSSLREFRISKESAESDLREVEAQITAARTRLARELSKLRG